MSNQFPFMYPGLYSPGQMAFNNNPELSQLISMFSGRLLGQMAGPGNFVPHMMPGQALMDQFAMRNYQNQTRTASFNLAASGAQNNDVASRLLGMRSIATRDAPTDMNREQAAQMAQVLNNPATKMFAGMMIGPENVEMMLHGSRGDVQSLGSAVNRIGYFRKDPGGGERMDAESLEDFTTGVFSHLYEPQGDLDKLAKTARAGGVAAQPAIEKLQTAADMRDRRVVSDEDVQKRLTQVGDVEVDRLYKKYVQGGKATDMAEQAKELTRFDRAIKESKVLGSDETTIGQLETAAFKRPAANMHGFTAGQAGQLMDTLFQRGALPPTLGNLDAKDRVSAIAETKLDDATITRLAESMARRELTAKNEAGADGKKFSDMTPIEQEEQIQALTNKKGGTLEQINATQAAAMEVASGKSKKSAEDVLQMAGGEALAGNADAGRAASRLKDYTESLAAVRDIFGDNGNPNAPMPALLAALDQLTLGGMGSMDPKRTATTLRQMQSTAREAGIGMQQMAAMTAGAGALGSQLGIAPSITMQNVAMAMGMTKTAVDRGAFSNNTPGAMSKEQHQEEALKHLQHGDASLNAKAMAAMSRIYAADPKKFKGTELEAAVAAYKDRSSGGKYKYDPTPDKPKSGDEVERNLFENVGRGKHHEVLRILQDGGATRNDYESVVHDARTMAEFGVSGAGMMTQKTDMLQNITAAATGGIVENRLAGTEVAKDLGEGGMNLLGEELSEMVFDSARMGVADQQAFLQQNIPQKLTQHFMEQGLGDKEAAKMAAQVSEQMFGDGKGGMDGSKVNRLIGDVGTAAQYYYGKNLVQLNQMLGNGADKQSMLEFARSEAHSNATKRLVGLGSESTPMGRMSDYFMDIGKRGENFSLDNFVQEMAPFVSDQDLLQRYAGDMGAGLHTLSTMRDKFSVTDKYINEQAASGNIDTLKKLGNFDEKNEVFVAKEQLEKARATKLESLKDPEEIEAAYASAFKQSGAHLTPEEKKQLLAKSEAFTAEADKEYLDRQQIDTGKRQVTLDTLKTRAYRSIGTALEGFEAQQADVEMIQRAAYRGEDKDARNASAGAFQRLFKDAGGKAGELAADKKALEEIINTDGEGGLDKILSRLDISKEKFEQDKTAEKKSNEQRFAESLYTVQRSDELQQLDKVADEKAVQGIAQKTDKVELAAQNVYINGAKAGQAAGGTTAAAPAASPAATPQKPGSPIPATKEGIDAEIAALGQKNSTVFNTLFGPSDADKQRRDELLKQREVLVAEEKKAAATAPAATSPATQAAAAPPQDKPLPEAKTADKDPATAADIRQQTDVAAVQATGGTKEEAKRVVRASGGDPADLDKAVADHSAAKEYAADPVRAKYEADIARSQKMLEAGRKNEDPEIRKELESVNAAAIKTKQEQLRAYEVAKESGIPWNAATGSSEPDRWKTRGDGVPVSVNGQDVDPAVLKEDEIKSVIGAIEMSAMMDDGNMSPADTAQLEKYKSALAEKQKAASTPAAKEEAAIAAKNDAAIQQQAGLKPGEKPTVDAAAPPTAKKERAQKEFDAAENKSLELYANLSPAEREEVEYYEERKQMDAWRQTMNDPTKSPEERRDAEEELKDAKGYEELSQSIVVGKRMAEDAGIDSSGDVIVENGRPTIGGVALDPEEFKRKLADFKAGMKNHGDPLSDKSREYALAAIDARKKERALNRANKEDVGAKNDAELQQKAGVAPPPSETPAQTTEPQQQASTPYGPTPPSKDDPLTRARMERQRELTKNYEANDHFSGNRLAQFLVTEQAKAELPSASALPPEKTAGIQQSGGQGSLGSANIHPAAANPEQQPSGGDYTAATPAGGSGRGDNGNITLSGSLRLEGLHEAILDATGNKAVQTPGGGVPVVPGKASGLGGMPSGRHNHTA